MEARQRLSARLKQRLRDEFVGISGYVQPLEMGPPVGRPIQYRISGPDIDKVREYAMALAARLDANPNVGEMIYDWNEPGRVLKIDIAQDKARQLGLSSEDVAQMMNGVVTGATITQVRDSIYLVNLVGRSEEGERNSPETLENLQIVTPTAPPSRSRPSPPWATSWSSHWSGAAIANPPSPSRPASTATCNPPT